MLTVISSAGMERFINKLNKQVQAVDVNMGTVEEHYCALAEFVREVLDNFET